MPEVSWRRQQPVTSRQTTQQSSSRRAWSMPAHQGPQAPLPAASPQTAAAGHALAGAGHTCRGGGRAAGTSPGIAHPSNACVPCRTLRYWQARQLSCTAGSQAALSLSAAAHRSTACWLDLRYTPVYSMVGSPVSGSSSTVPAAKVRRVVAECTGLAQSLHASRLAGASRAPVTMRTCEAAICVVPARSGQDGGWELLPVHLQAWQRQQGLGVCMPA
jgi:hypothetical protein